jgi:hypothetical protein
VAAVPAQRHQRVGEARPPVDLDQQVGQVDLGESRLDQLAQSSVLVLVGFSLGDEISVS